MDSSFTDTLESPCLRKLAPINPRDSPVIDRGGQDLKCVDLVDTYQNPRHVVAYRITTKFARGPSSLKIEDLAAWARIN